MKTIEPKAGDAILVFLNPDEKGRPREAVVVVADDGRPRVYLNECKHIPIPLDAGTAQLLDDETGMLFCGTHGALYRLEDGYCTAGPCTGESLDTLPFVVDGDGRVLIDEDAAPMDAQPDAPPEP